MPYKCVHCSAVYPDASPELLSGCTDCRSKFFFYIKDDKLKEIMTNKSEELQLSSKEKMQVENDIRDIVGVKDEEVPVFLDFESVKIVKPGKYLLDLQKLFSAGKPRVYKLEDGKYIVDLTSSFRKDIGLEE